MAIGELARILSAVNAIFERIEEETALSRKAAAALAIMTLDTTRESVFSNEWLREQFLSYRISTQRSVAKDASMAKSDLQAAGYIAIGLHMNQFSITESGKSIVSRIHDVANVAIKDVGLVEVLRGTVRTISTEKVGPQREEIDSAGRKTG